MTVVTALLACLVGVLLLPTLSDLLSLLRIVVRRVLRSHAEQRSSAPQRPRLLILVPAHHEEMLIEGCVQALARLVSDGEHPSVIVVADDCEDRTAPRARAAGAQCLERVEPALRGKPHAIAWALKRLPLDSYDAVVIVDADTRVDRNLAEALAAAAPLDRKVAQPYNDVWNRGDNALTRMAAVLNRAHHRFSFHLKQLAGLNVPLGTGMCIGTTVLAAHGWRAFSLCEDWELYALLTARGVRIERVPQARLYAQEALYLRQSASQRRRWLAGKLVVLAQYGGELVRSRHIGFVKSWTVSPSSADEVRRCISGSSS